MTSQILLELRVQLVKSKLPKKSNENPTVLTALKKVFLKPSQTEQLSVKLRKQVQKRKVMKMSVKLDFFTRPFLPQCIKTIIPASCKPVMAIRYAKTAF